MTAVIVQQSAAPQVVVLPPDAAASVVSQSASPQVVVSQSASPQVLVSAPVAPKVVVVGIQGPRGTDGTDGTNGTDGTDGTDGTNGTDGTDGTDGTNGTNGTNGTDGTSVTVDTRQNILATTPQQGALAYATDVQRLLTYDGGWQESSALMIPRSGPVDMGVEQASNLAGYGVDYITDKRLSNVSIGSNADTELGGVRVVFSESLGRNLTQVYLDGVWQTVLTGVNIQTDSAEAVPDIEFTDFSPWVLSLITGNSDAKDANGVPIVQNMKIDMGAYSAPLVIDGGSF